MVWCCGFYPAKSLNGASSRILNGPGTKSRLFEGPKTFWGAWDFFGPLNGTRDSEGHSEGTVALIVIILAASLLRLVFFLTFWLFGTEGLAYPEEQVPRGLTQSQVWWCRRRRPPPHPTRGHRAPCTHNTQPTSSSYYRFLYSGQPPPSSILASTK